MKLFSEKVEPTFTSSDLNILTVEDFQEVFFDVFEFEINGKKFIAEKVSEYKGSPVVNIPLVMDGKEFTAPFVLQEGRFEILFNKNNSNFIGESNDNSEEDIIDGSDEVNQIEEIIFEKKEDILAEIRQARQSAEKYAEKIKQQKDSETEKYFEERKKTLQEEIEESKKGLVEEFLTIVENAKRMFYDAGEMEKEKLSTLVEVRISNLTEELLDSIDKKQSKAEEIFSEKINELATNILTDVLLKEIDKNKDTAIAKINEKFKVVASNLTEAITNSRAEVEEKLENKLDSLSDSILNLEKLNIELNDLINKGDNRALSRIGNIKTQLEKNISDNNISILSHIDSTEEKIKTFYNDRIAIVEERVSDLSEENKQYFINLINESKQSLLNEISNIKVDVPNIVIEKSNGKKEVDLKGIKSELEKIIGTRFSNELQSLKRLIEMSSGGGSVAKQFANGGTMEGNLIVTNSLSAGRIYTTQLDVLSANINVIDIKQYELSGFNVTGDATVMGSISASDRIYSNTGINAPQIRLQTGSFYGQINAPAVPTQNISVNLPNSSGTIATNNTAVMLVGSQSVSGAKTFTGQVELTNQQAISGSSALTRQLGDDRYGTRYDILSADISLTSANFINVVSITLPVGLYQIDAFLASAHTTNVGSKIRFSTNQNIKVGLTDNYSRPTVAAISWPVVDGAYNNSHPYAIRTEVAGTEFRRTITGIIEVLINGTTIGLDFAQSVSTPLSPSTARARSHILARKIN